RAELVAARHQRGTGRGARGADVEVGELDALAGEGVDVRRKDNRATAHGEVAVADVVGHDDHDVRPAPRVIRAGRDGRDRRQGNQNRGAARSGVGHGLAPAAFAFRAAFLAAFFAARVSALAAARPLPMSGWSSAGRYRANSAFFEAYFGLDARLVHS